MTFFEQFTEGVIGVPSNTFYRKQKKDGSFRIIGKPNEPMKEIQERLLDFLRKHAPRLQSAAAAKDGLGSVRNARAHNESEFVFKLDFVNAFGNTDGRKIAAFVAARVRKYTPRVHAVPSEDEWFVFLSQCTLMRRGGLIQGSKVSPLLLDWYCEETVDRPIRRLLCRAMGKRAVTYTRYVDDLVFSSRHRITRALRAAIRDIIIAAGYLENRWKTEVIQLSKSGTVKVTGPRIGKQHHFGLSRRKVKEIERMLDTQLNAPLFHTMKSEEIDGKLRYLLDVTRGKKELNALEARAIDKYREWCERNGRDAAWPARVLARKWTGKQPSRQQKRAARK